MSLARASSRRYAAAAAAETNPADTSSTPQPIPSESATASSNAYAIQCGTILTRPPLLTRKLTDFENSFFFYQKRLNERLALPFITSTYFKQDTSPQMDWTLKVKERQGSVAKELGVYQGKKSKAWDDELLVGDTLSKQETVTEILLKDSEMRISDDAEELPEADRVPAERPQARETEADRSGDVKRLDRKLDRTLYLVVKGKSGAWEFPSSNLAKDENLHQGAKRVLEQAAGVNMNTWLVGRVPVAHVVSKPAYKSDGSVETQGNKTFFLKGRIMAGQADLTGNELGLVDFKWLTREELEKELEPGYYHSVKGMMTDR